MSEPQNQRWESRQVTLKTWSGTVIATWDEPRGNFLRFPEGLNLRDGDGWPLERWHIDQDGAKVVVTVGDDTQWDVLP